MKDYMAVAGNLGITHMVFLSQTLMHTTLRMGHFPRGPSLFFNVSKYALMRDVHHAHAKPATLGGIEYKHAPLVLLDGFEGNADVSTSLNDTESDCVPLGHKEKHLLCVYLQNMFPVIHVPTMRIEDAKRVLLFHLCRETDEIFVRHYMVKMHAHEPAGRETLEALKEKFLQEESKEDVGPVQKSVVVSEVGPRLTLQLTKIIDGFMDAQKARILYSRYPMQLRDNHVGRESEALLDPALSFGEEPTCDDRERIMPEEEMTSERGPLSDSMPKRRKVSFKGSPKRDGGIQSENRRSKGDKKTTRSDEREKGSNARRRA
jgi:ribosome biogenesis protein SSF1/2